jgi:hypothetical protein
MEKPAAPEDVPQASRLGNACLRNSRARLGKDNGLPGTGHSRRRPAMAFDTLKFATKLKAAGVPEAHHEIFDGTAVIAIKSSAICCIAP